MIINKIPRQYLALLVMSLPTTLSAAELKTGYFIDAPVTGLFYKTSSNISGLTDKGAFSYQEGDLVSFYLGRDENGYLLNQVSSQEVLTPNLISTLPSKSINLTRLLLSLDSTPENRREILLLSDWLAKPEIQKQLKQLDLTELDPQMLSSLDVDLVSMQEAVEHLNQSQEYITQHFASDQVLFSPLNKRMKNIVVKKRDYSGRICVYDLRLTKHPKYRPPYGSITFEVKPDVLVEYPDVGDRFRGCHIEPKNIATSKTTYTPLDELTDVMGFARCAKQGCTRNDLNGFDIEKFDDDGDWKYRSMALNYDPTTQLLMEKTQGLGRMEKIPHPNLIEQIWFTYPANQHKNLPYEGVWQETLYTNNQIQMQCLLIHAGDIKSLPSDYVLKDDETCPIESALYQRNVSQQYGDMWWVKQQSSMASIEQMNITVRWYPQTAGQPKLTSWEYLPAGKAWDQGILYRYQQTIARKPDGSEKLNTHTISEYKKIAGVGR